MNKTLALLALSFLSITTVVRADEQYPITAPPDHKAETNAYARAAGLPPLVPSNNPELRIWVANFRGTVRGIAVTPGGVRQFVTSQSYNKKDSATVKQA